MKSFTFAILATIFASGAAALPQLGLNCNDISNFGIGSGCVLCPTGQFYVPTVGLPVCNPLTSCCPGQCCSVTV